MIKLDYENKDEMRERLKANWLGAAKSWLNGLELFSWLGFLSASLIFIYVLDWTLRWQYR